MPIYGEQPTKWDSMWGCKHTIASMNHKMHRIMRATLDDFRFYMTNRRGKVSVTMITLDLVAHLEISLLAHRIEKPV